MPTDRCPKLLITKQLRSVAAVEGDPPLDLGNGVIGELDCRGAMTALVGGRFVQIGARGAKVG